MNCEALYRQLCPVNFNDGLWIKKDGVKIRSIWRRVYRRRLRRTISWILLFFKWDIMIFQSFISLQKHQETCFWTIFKRGNIETSKLKTVPVLWPIRHLGCWADSSFSWKVEYNVVLSIHKSCWVYRVYYQSDLQLCSLLGKHMNGTYGQADEWKTLLYTCTPDCNSNVMPSRGSESYFSSVANL